MAWMILLISAVFEAVWATALGMSDGLSSPWPTAVFFAALIVSMGGLAIAVKEIPIGTAYAVWVGVGAALTVSYALLTGTESATPARLLCIAGIVIAVIGLKLAPSGDQSSSSDKDSQDSSDSSSSTSRSRSSEASR